MRRLRTSTFAFVAVLGLLALGCTIPATAQIAVVTRQYDMGRTGWNQNETVLTPTNVSAAGSFGLLATVALDGRTDAQPLVVPKIKVEGDLHMGTHDVVYVATENNTVYAIDPTRAIVLRQRNLGMPVNQPIGCNTAISGVGVQGTPVIDIARHAIYVMAYTMEGTTPTYTLHMLDLSSLADKMPPAVVQATQLLSNGQTISFSATLERQRPGLLEANNAIYAAFGGFCDANGNSRGWVLGWKAGNLNPIVRTAGKVPTGELTNRLPVKKGEHWFGSSIWMSGAGLASDGTALYFVTANSDTSGTTYDGINNIQHSVVKLSLNTMSQLDLFTPYNVAYLDQTDSDFGSGGIMLLPSLGPTVPPLATALGKFPTMYLLNRDHLGGFTPNGPDNVLAQVHAGRCVCAESYFATPTPTIVSSGGNELNLWHIQTSPSIALTLYARTGILKSGTTEDTSFFTTVSSNGADANSTLIWTVMRPISTTDPHVLLEAYNAIPGRNSLLTNLYTVPAGTWSGAYNAANLVPVVANGRVYVASDSLLSIFGLLPDSTTAAN